MIHVRVGNMYQNHVQQLSADCQNHVTLFVFPNGDDLHPTFRRFFLGGEASVAVTCQNVSGEVVAERLGEVIRPWDGALPWQCQ